MQIQIDTREKARAIKNIVKHFEDEKIPFHSSKLYVGDYVNLLNPLVFIDRKQNIAEIAQNATGDHKRFKAELERVKEIGAKMYVLIEEDNVDGKPIKDLSDIIFWKPKYSTIVGEQIYRILASWEYKYPIKFCFCNKADTGREIVRLLEEKAI